MGRSTKNQQTLIARESVAGVAETTGFQRLTAMTLTPGWEGESEPYMGGSSKVATSVILTDELSRWDVQMSQCFNHLGLPLSSRISVPVTTTPGGGTNSRQHVFNLSPDREDSKMTYTVRYGDGYQVFEAAYGVFDSLSLDIVRGRLNFGSSFMSKSAEDGSSIPTSEVQELAITGSPTGGTFTITVPFLDFGAGLTTAAIDYDATAAEVKTALVALAGLDTEDVVTAGGPLPGTAVTIEFVGRFFQQNLDLLTTTDSFTGGSSPESAITQTTPGAEPTAMASAPVPSVLWDWWADDTWAGLGTSKLLACYQGKVDLGSKFDPDPPINSDVISFESLIEKEQQDYNFDLSVGVDATAISLIDSFKSGTLKFMRAKVEGPIIEGSIPYSIQLDFPVFIVSRGRITKAPNSPAVTVPLKAKIAKDPTTGNALRVTIVNTVTGY